MEARVVTLAHIPKKPSHFFYFFHGLSLSFWSTPPLWTTLLYFGGLSEGALLEAIVHDFMEGFTWSNAQYRGCFAWEMDKWHPHSFSLLLRYFIALGFLTSLEVVWGYYCLFLLLYWLLIVWGNKTQLAWLVLKIFWSYVKQGNFYLCVAVHNLHLADLYVLQ